LEIHGMDRLYEGKNNPKKRPESLEPYKKHYIKATIPIIPSS